MVVSISSKKNVVANACAADSKNKNYVTVGGDVSGAEQATREKVAQ